MISSDMPRTISKEHNVEKLATLLRPLLTAVLLTFLLTGLTSRSVSSPCVLVSLVLKQRGSEAVHGVNGPYFRKGR